TEPQSRALLLRAVARIALLREERPHLRFKELDLRRGGLGGIGRRNRERGERERKSEQPPHRRNPRSHGDWRQECYCSVFWAVLLTRDPQNWVRQRFLEA